MIGYKYVKFSRGTAKDNPDMVLREYRRLLDISKKEWKWLEEHTNKIPIPLDDSILKQIATLYTSDMPRDRRLEREAFVHFNFNQIENTYLTLKAVHESEIEAKRHYKSLEKERVKFRNRFLLKH